MTLRQFLVILRARSRIALAIFGGVVAAAVLVSLVLPARYTAEATVVADSRSDALAAPGAAPEDPASFLATQVSIISSDRVVDRVANRFTFEPASDAVLHQQWQSDTKGKKAFADWLAERLHKALRVAGEGQSNVIDITITWPDALNAAVLANAIAKTYLQTSIELRVAPAEQFSGAVDERAATLRGDLQTKQNRLNEFMSANKLIPSDQRMDIELTRLAELSTQLVAAQGLRQESQSRQQEMSGHLDDSPEILQNTLITELKAELARDDARQRDLEVNLGPNHPESQRNLAQIASLKDRIATESHRVSASLASANNVNTRHEAELTAQIDAQKMHIIELRSLHDQASLLQDDVTNTQKALDAVTDHLAQSSLVGAAQQSSAALLSSASSPDKRSAPDRVTIGLLGIFFGLLLGVGVPLLQETTDRRVRSEAQLEQMLGVPLLGKISPAPRRAALPNGQIQALLRSES
jgi:chain length determinant protein EpsF